MNFFPIPGRVIEPEWLDSLPADDPSACRSRRDLVLIDHLMGNTRWICRHLPPGNEIIELGAGSGRLAGAVSRRGHDVTAMDLAPAPPNLDRAIRWVAGDFFRNLHDHSATTVVGSLILHHFQNAELSRLGRLLNHRTRLVFAEPLRDALPLALSKLAAPFVGRVTRHDMPVSIRAGFLPGELAAALALGADWSIFESPGPFGSLRFLAWKN